MGPRLRIPSPHLHLRPEDVPRVAGVVLKFVIAALVLASTVFAAGQDIPLGVAYVCNGERMFVENCNIRDTSDTSKCMVGHPDTVLANGLMKYTYETRGDLKKLLPTCKQPTAAYNANAAAAVPGAPPPSSDPETRAMNRCITSGWLPARTR